MPSPLRAWPLRLWAAETAHITRALRWLPWARRKPLLLTAALNVILVGLGAGVVSACTNIAMKVKLDETGEEYAFAFPYSFKQFLPLRIRRSSRRSLISMIPEPGWPRSMIITIANEKHIKHCEKATLKRNPAWLSSCANGRYALIEIYKSAPAYRQ